MIDGNGKFLSATESHDVSREARSDFTVFAKMQADRKINSAIDIDRIDGAKQLITYAPIEILKNMPELGGSVIVANDTKDVFALQKELLYALIAGVGMTAAVVRAIAIFLGLAELLAR